MRTLSYNRSLFVTFILGVLFSFNLSIPQLIHQSQAYPSDYVSEVAAKNNPFHKTSGSDQVIYDYFPSTDKKESKSSMNDLVNQMINSLVQEKVVRPEVCGDGQDNDGNGQVDEICNVSNVPNVPQDDKQQSPQVEPGQEMCGDGQDNDGNGQVDENCNVSNVPNVPKDYKQSPQVEPEKELCGDGKDNKCKVYCANNGQVDENCNVSNVPQDDKQVSDEKKKLRQIWSTENISN